MADSTGVELVHRIDQVKSRRTIWEAHWEEVAELVLPSHAHAFQGHPLLQDHGSKRNQKQYDSTAAIALTRFASVMESMITPRNQKWHRLRPTDRALLRDRDVLLWFDEVTDILFRRRYETAANYASQQHEVYMSLGAFGTGSLFIDAGTTGGLRYRACHLGDTYFLLNHQGLVDTVFRRVVMTARQMRQAWPDERLPDQVIRHAENEPEEEHEVFHIVMPREEVDRSRADFRGMPWASYYVEVDSKSVLEEGGYREFPYAISRHITAPREEYGRSPAMAVLPNIKVLNQQKKTHLKIGHRRADPVLLVHDDGVLDGFSLKPGALNSGGVSAEGRSLVQPLPIGDPVMNERLMEMERAPINEAFLVTLFQILVDNGTMTATEVMQRAQEKAQLIAPVMGRQESEALGPQIQRELDILEDQGLLPEMPEALLEAQGDYEIVYESPLARAARAEEANGLIRSLQILTPYVEGTGDLSPFDHYDWDQITPDVQRITGMPEKWRRSLEQVQQLRAGRAQQQQQQQAIEAAPAMASMMRSGGGGG